MYSPSEIPEPAKSKQKSEILRGSRSLGQPCNQPTNCYPIALHIVHSKMASFWLDSFQPRNGSKGIASNLQDELPWR